MASPEPLFAATAVPQSAAVSVRRMSERDAAAWDRFVFAAENGTFFHRAGWRTIFEDIFGLRTQFLLAERNGEIAGVLPLVHQRSLLFGNALVAAPFCVEGGPLASDARVLAALDAAAIGLMERSGASYIEFRSRKASRPGWTVKGDRYASFSRPILPNNEQNLLAIPRKQRAVVRKTLQSSLTSTVEGTVDRLFAVLAESMRNLGTPVFPKKYFTALRHVF